MNKLDRIYVNLMQAQLLDARPCCGIVWNFSHEVSGSFDHLPVAATLGNDGAAALRSFPRWLAKTPEYEQQCIILFKQTRIPQGTSFETIVRYKGL